MKTCKICEKNEDEVVFYESNKSICKCCRLDKDLERRKEKHRILGLDYKEIKKAKEGYKFCSHCRHELSLDNFYQLGSLKKDGTPKIYSRCKKCETEIVKNHINRKNYIITSNNLKKLKIESDPIYREHTRTLEANSLNSTKGFIANMVRAAKKRANRDGLEFSLVKEDITLPEFCPILEIPLERGTIGNYLNTWSLDRKDNSKGYTKENCMVISQLANSMKNCATPEQLKTFAKNITKYIN